MSGRAAVFLDRDGTIIEDRGYLRHPDDVRLLPASASALRALNGAGWPAVVVTNQSGIARGLLTEDDYTATADRLDRLLQAEHARLDARYHCPHLPEVTGPCDCRKPGPALYERAAIDLAIDLGRSWWVGDRLRDLEPAMRFGGRGALVLTGDGLAESQRPEASVWPSVPDLGAAVRLILAAEP